jgi:phosphate transport system substrate-binding protein
MRPGQNLRRSHVSSQAFHRSDRGAGATAAAARDQIRRVGSSTVFPYTQAVAEQFANNTGFPSPIVESTGTGGGMQIFCGGIGEDFADITGASRAMKRVRVPALHVQNGVDSITEARIGSDGLSITISRENDFDWDMTLTEVYLALGRQVPVDGEWADNPYTNWNQINPDFPDMAIEVLGPPPTSGTRDAFVELAMWEGCMELRLRRRRRLRRATGSKRTARACAPTARSSRPARTTT